MTLRQTTIQATKRVMCGLAAGLVVVFAPAPYAFADSVDSSTPSASTSCTPVTPDSSGTNQPTGASASTYTYNSCTGLWENQYFTWSPATHTTTPKIPYQYTCNPSTWRWETTIWNYSPVKNSFYPTSVSFGTLPSGGLIAPDSLYPCAPAPPSSVSNALGTNGSSPDPSSSATSTSNAASATSNTSASIANAIGSSAVSGDAGVMSNTTGGNATSGSALAMANILNAVQSQSSLLGGGVVTFVANIDGNVQGNLIVDPGQLQPASNSDSLNNNLTVNSQTAGQITNDVNLGATSGSANVSHNTTAGNATTGNATAIADVINMLNSIVSAGKSFVGVININGNLHGDILVPQKFLDSLIASNAPSTTVSLSQSQANNLGITTTNNLSTTNNITSSATSGSADVSHNTTAGNATSGNASTKVTVFNLTGSQIIGANCLLVFVNVSGKWVGVIMNAPVGTTAAALGSGITGNTVNDAAINAATNDSITNNINLAAASGDATVDGNTTAGNATSGNANTAVNLLNLNNSQFDLSGWFGVLFINIFGNWYGSFGTYTPPVAASGGPKPSHHATGGSQTFQFVPTSSTTTAAETTDTLSSLRDQVAHTTGDVLGSVGNKLTNPPMPASTNTNSRFQTIGGILLAIGLVSLAAERTITARNAARRSDA